MKGLKKLLTGILAGAMALTLALGTGSAMPVHAEEGKGEITVSNTTEGKEYKIFKVFDATYSGDNVAYSISKTADAEFIAALKAESSPFELTDFGDGYNVIRKTSAKDTDITSFIQANGGTYDEKAKTWSDGHYGAAVQTKTGNGGAITFSGLDYGYYYITSTLGATVTINSAVPNASVIDKNQETTIDKQESVDGGTTWKYQGQGTVETTTPNQMIGSVVNYKLEGTVTQYVGENKVTFLKFVDTMSSGLSANKDVKVFVAGNDVTATATIEYAGDNATVTTITVPTVDAAGEFLYASNAAYEITYSATVNENALGEVQNNEVTLTDNNNSDLGKDKTEVKNYKIVLKKTDSNKHPLADAKFLLYTSAEGDTNIPVVLIEGTGDATSEVNNVYRVAYTEDDLKNAVTMVTGKTGIIEVKGLKNGDYYFEETEAPAGYNKLTERAYASPSVEGTMQSIEDNDGLAEVINTTGLRLPSTGGIGTTIFYIIGAVLAIAGIAYFMVRRKADAE